MKKRLSFHERVYIKNELEKGKKAWLIADELGRNRRTIYVEIDRNGGISDYNPVKAQERYEVVKSKPKPLQNYSEDKIKLIEKLLKKGFSFEQIKGYCDKNNIDMISIRTMYRWFYRGLILKGDRVYLRHKGKKRKQKGVVRFNRGKSIRQRDKSILNRENLGDYEVDTVVSKHDTKKGIVTAVCRKTRLLVARFVEDRKASTVTQALIDMLKDKPVNSITCDNGSEFAYFEEIEKALDTNVYFADSFKAWQRGTNENTNGLLREYFPKGTSFKNRTDDELEKAVALINERPCRLFGFRSRLEIFKKELNSIK